MGMALTRINSRRLRRGEGSADPDWPKSGPGPEIGTEGENKVENRQRIWGVGGRSGGKLVNLKPLGTPKDGMQRIVMLIWKFHPLSGGAENQCLRLSKRLVELGHPVTVLTHRAPGSADSELLSGIRVVRVPVPLGPGRIADRLYHAILKRLPTGIEGKPAPGSLLHRIHRLLRYLRGGFSVLLPQYVFFLRAFIRLLRMRKEFDICHVHEAHWIASVGILAGRLSGKPCLIKQATWKNKGSISNMSWPSSALFRWADAYVAISTQIAEELEECGIPRGKIRRIPNGVAIPAIAWRGEHRDPLRLVFVGNLGQQPEKGIDILLNAWAEVQRELPGAVLDILGGGEGDKLKAMSRGLGIDSSVRFLGDRRDVIDLLLQASAFVLPSRREGMSNALLEAMALGMPCIATAVSGSMDLIKDGENGFLVPAEAPAPLAQAILKLLKDPAAGLSLGSAARQTILQDFTLEKVALEYSHLYRTLYQKASVGNPAYAFNPDFPQ
jgi:glycosyltransferase involved in cell wall biosynthesis